MPEAVVGKMSMATHSSSYKYKHRQCHTMSCRFGVSGFVHRLHLLGYIILFRNYMIMFNSVRFKQKFRYIRLQTRHNSYKIENKVAISLHIVDSAGKKSIICRRPKVTLCAGFAAHGIWAVAAWAIRDRIIQLYFHSHPRLYEKGGNNMTASQSILFRHAHRPGERQSPAEAAQSDEGRRLRGHKLRWQVHRREDELRRAGKPRLPAPPTGPRLSATTSSSSAACPTSPTPTLFTSADAATGLSTSKALTPTASIPSRRAYTP